MLQEELSKKIEEPKLEPWPEQQLVSVGGTPIYVCGSARFEISLAGKNFRQQMVVARALETGPILGLDFLQSNRVITDLENQQISFNRGEETFPIGVNPLRTVVPYMRQY